MFRVTRQFGCRTVVALAACAAGLAVVACPFCSAPSQTLSEELASAKVAVIARLSAAAASGEAGVSDPTTGLAKFEVVEVIRHAEDFPDLKEIEAIYFGENEPGKMFLIVGLAPSGLAAEGSPEVEWTTPLPLSERAVDYVKQLGSLPEKGPDRLAYFWQHFEHEDPLLAQDAYDEFARAPYKEVIDLGPRLDRDQLMEWINDPEIGPTRRRLYLTLLGICGQPEDADKLEVMLKYDYQQMKAALDAVGAVMSVDGSAVGAPIAGEIVQADVRRQQQCLDALVAAYLKLKGPDGLALIEEKFLANPKAEYTQVYATVMALRFHGEETDEIPRERLLESFRLVLDNPEISDQVIPDLARWEDWSVLERLLEMFKASEPDAWIRQPVISYVLVASEVPGDVGERAGKALAEIEAIDPDGVKRAQSYMAFGLPTRTASTAAAPGPEDMDEVPQGPEEAEPTDAVAAADAVEPAVAPVASTAAAPSRTTLIVAPLVACVLLMGVFALLLRGADVRGPSDAS